jgi:molybdopterin-guanine dinucleotide biosynthesis protein A
VNRQLSPIGVILTGGASRRMGVDKAFITIAGTPMVMRVANAMTAAGCETVFCQGGDAARLSLLGLRTDPDPQPGAGPLAAIAAALSSAGRSILVAACDLPDLDPASLKAVIRAGTSEPAPNVAVAVADGRKHLVSMWTDDALQPLTELIAEGVSAYGAALDRLGAVAVPVDPAAVRNINRSDDLR